jgi:hypothetical protein
LGRKKLTVEEEEEKEKSYNKTMRVGQTMVATVTVMVTRFSEN